MSEKRKVNKFLLNKIASSGFSVESKQFDILLEKAKRLTQIGVDSESKARTYKIVNKASKDLGINLSLDVYSEAINKKISNSNDACFFILKSEIDNRQIKKVAYPNTFGLQVDKEEVDLNKWLNIVHKIYDAVRGGTHSKEDALEYYSNYLNKEREEDIRFKKWFEYYSKGEHLKYSSNKEQGMKKKAVYMSNLGQSATNYTHGGGRGGFNMPGDSFGEAAFDQTLDRAKLKADEAEAFDAWKSKLHSACRRMDRLLRSKHMKEESYMNLAEILLNLSHQIHCLKLASTITDVTHKTANTLKKHGQGDLAEVLVKIAQEAPEAAVPQAQPEGGQQVGGEAGITEQQDTQQAPVQEDSQEEPADPNDPKSAIPSGDDVESAQLKDITPIPGARPGEYEELAGDVSLDDAASKLDEVAGMLADRRIIRQLAEFDIMLDKIGIASMFPELAESQSKLIDAFSYALTRVTKMMGQLANAKSIIDSKSGVPGQTPPAQEPTSELRPEEAGEASSEGLEEV
tara:strand:- start:2909 stop:4453 length:1545 start_codon:yes stop_codon:yes gene_type:complete